MPNQKNDNRSRNQNPNNSDDLRDLRHQDSGSSKTTNQSGLQSGQQQKSQGTGQNYSGGTGLQGKDQSRSSSISGQKNSGDVSSEMDSDESNSQLGRSGSQDKSGNTGSRGGKQGNL